MMLRLTKDSVVGVVRSWRLSNSYKVDFALNCIEI